MKTRILSMTSALLLLGLVACAMEPRLTSLSIVYLDAYVKREPPAVYIFPPKAPPAPLKALIVPFTVGQDIASAKMLGTQGDSMIGLNLQIFDVKNGQPVWHMAQAGRMEPGMTHDFIIAMTRNRMPTDPINAIVMCLAHDTGELIKNWNYDLIDEKGHKRKTPKS